MDLGVLQQSKLVSGQAGECASKAPRIPLPASPLRRAAAPTKKPADAGWRRGTAASGGTAIYSTRLVTPAAREHAPLSACAGSAGGDGVRQDQHCIGEPQQQWGAVALEPERLCPRRRPGVARAAVAAPQLGAGHAVRSAPRRWRARSSIGTSKQWAGVLHSWQGLGLSLQAQPALHTRAPSGCLSRLPRAEPAPAAAPPAEICEGDVQRGSGECRSNRPIGCLCCARSACPARTLCTSVLVR